MPTMPGQETTALFSQMALPVKRRWPAHHSGGHGEFFRSTADVVPEGPAAHLRISAGAELAYHRRFGSLHARLRTPPGVRTVASPVRRGGRGLPLRRTPACHWPGTGASMSGSSLLAAAINFTPGWAHLRVKAHITYLMSEFGTPWHRTPSHWRPWRRPAGLPGSGLPDTAFAPRSRDIHQRPMYRDAGVSPGSTSVRGKFWLRSACRRRVRVLTKPTRRWPAEVAASCPACVEAVSRRRRGRRGRSAQLAGLPVREVEGVLGGRRGCRRLQAQPGADHWPLVISGRCTSSGTTALGAGLGCSPPWRREFPNKVPARPHGSGRYRSTRRRVPADGR